MAKTKAIPQSPLESALEFLSIVHNAKQDNSLYADMGMGTARVFNMVVGAGITIAEDIAACPHIGLFLAALARCGTNYAVTQLSRTKLLVRSGEFHAFVPCSEPEPLSWCLPDAAMGILDDRFMDALAKVAPLASTTAKTVLETSIQLNPGSVIACNNHLAMEAWHGLDFPSGLLLPKSSYAILKKAKKKIVSFGFSPVSVTFHFADGSWMFSKLFQDRWPDVQSNLNVPVNPHEISADFFPAVAKVEPFSTTGNVWVDGNRISSHPFDVTDEGSGLSLTFSGPPHSHRNYFASDLKLIAKHVNKWDENCHGQRTYFVGDNIRGLISHEACDRTAIAIDDDDIPF